jgi:hypothetical protein
MKKRLNTLSAVSIGLMGVLLLGTACMQVPSIDPDQIPTRAESDCPGLESQLYQVAQAKDPLKMAEQIGLILKDEKVQVLFVLEDEETDFLLAYDVELGTQSGNQVQGYAPIERLCELTNLEAVLAIRRPAQPVLD